MELALLVVLEHAEMNEQTFISWCLAQITPLSIVLLALLIVLAARLGFIEAALHALSAHCGG